MSNGNDSGANPDFHELEPLPEMSGGSGGPPAKGTATAEAPRGPQEIEQAPLMLQKSALVLTIAALLPWLVPEGFNLPRLIAKAVILLGGWIAYCAVEHAHGRPTPLDGLGKAHKLALPGASFLLIAIGVGLTQLAPRWQGLIEAAALAVGILAWCQVHGYALGGKFNPTWALIIPVFGLAALVNIFVTLSLDVDGASKGLAILGSLGVAGAGGFAGYTLFIAIKEAKAHGEAKKRASSEARMAERRQKRSTKDA